ncbi:uncharacterized protein K452DRAFT_356977 [Aplosporella prunicola CBS 121167]|uniref:Uncharacterized protein n=1 Tax=Aplosporella prunicola CBS 121167 TaxID=1176127 RepID=A0A6A6BL82_9PEZI|nr:uncharacterized protein K452DRAFT_356977 [Aplosporella prunicola CBS 121167]KAF2144024.1 hypothetical protein K452DRAFT_356977 [Aplosporella prunicola CBS 121167]
MALENLLPRQIVAHWVEFQVIVLGIMAQTIGEAFAICSRNYGRTSSPGSPFRKVALGLSVAPASISDSVTLGFGPRLRKGYQTYQNGSLTSSCFSLLLRPELCPTIRLGRGHLRWVLWVYAGGRGTVEVGRQDKLPVVKLVAVRHGAGRTTNDGKVPSRNTEEHSQYRHQKPPPPRPVIMITAHSTAHGQDRINRPLLSVSVKDSSDPALYTRRSAGDRNLLIRWYDVVAALRARTQKAVWWFRAPLLPPPPPHALSPGALVYRTYLPRSRVAQHPTAPS